jgi:tRNA G10  N-methylase Trm11
MLGSDINKQAIKGSETNLEWFRNRYRIAPGKYHLENADAVKISSLLQGRTIKGIVTESTLGPV